MKTKENGTNFSLICIGNEKGGCGKSSTSLALSACLTELGFKALCVDCDPSGNLSAAALPDFPKYVLYDIFTGQSCIEDTICHTRIGDVIPTVKDIAPTTQGLPFMNKNGRKSLGDLFSSFVGQSGSYNYLNSLIRSPDYAHIFNQYDFIILDTQPSDSLLVLNALCCADDIIVVAEPNSASNDGFRMLINSIIAAKTYYKCHAKIDGLVFTRYDDAWKTRPKMEKEITELAEVNKIPVYKTKFRRSGSIETSMNECRPILDYMYQGWGASDSLNFTLEFLQKRGLTPRKHFPGVVTDEYGKLIFRRKGDNYYICEVNGSGVTVSTELFRADDVNDEFNQKVGKTIFYHKDALLNAIKTNGWTVTSADHKITELLQN